MWPTSPTIVKWRVLRLDTVRTVAARVEAVRTLRPPGVPEVTGYGFAGDTLRLECARVDAVPLAFLLPSLSASARTRVAALLLETVTHWKTSGFTHGDLSPRNILFEPELRRVWFIDWVLDLEGFEATPAFAGADVRRGRRSCASDRYAIDLILCILRGK